MGCYCIYLVVDFVYIYQVYYSYTGVQFPLCYTSRVPVEGKSSVCVICMKYRIIVLVIIIISLCQIILSYMANTSRTHAFRRARTHTHTLACTHPPASRRHHRGCRCSMGRCAPNHDEDIPSFRLFRLTTNGRSVLHSNKQSRVRGGIRNSFGSFSHIKKFLGRTETRTCDRMCFQTIQTV